MFKVLEKFQTYNVGDIGISSITVAELEFGAQKSQFPQKNQQALEQFLSTDHTVEIDRNSILKYRHWKETYQGDRTQNFFAKSIFSSR